MPTRDTPWPDGTPCWIDYGAADLDATKHFYSSLLGWDYTGGEPEFGGYLTATRNGVQAAGLGPQQDPNDPPRWTTYFATSDAAATAGRIPTPAARVRRADGGRPDGHDGHRPRPAGEPVRPLAGRRAHRRARIYNEPGALVWNEAAVDDPEAAKSFYAAVFGFRFDEVPGAGGYSTFTNTDHPLGGLGGHQAGSPKGWTTCFSVATRTPPSARSRRPAAR